MTCLPLLVASLLGSTAATPPTVALDLSPLDEAAYERLDGLTLERAAVVRLVQEGFAVVPRESNPDVLLSVELHAGEAVLVAIGRHYREQRRVLLHGPPAELQLELVHKLVELARAGRRPSSKPSSEPSSELPRSPPAPAESPPTPSRHGLATAGLLGRDGGFDLRLGVDVRAGHFLRLAFAAAWSPSASAGLQVHELWPSVGGSVALLRSERVDVELGLQLGALLHAFWLEAPDAAERTGARLDPFLSFPLVAVARLGGGLCAGVRGSASLVLRGREHTDGGRVLWRRGGVALDGGVALGWCR